MFNSAVSGFNTGRSIGGSLYKSGAVSSSNAGLYGGAIGAAIGLVADVYSLFQLAAARRRLMPPLKPLTGKAYITLFR